MKNYLKIFSIFIFLVNFSFAQTIIGKSDYIDLPTLNIKNINAKIDTGAKTSSLHAKNIKSTDGKNVIFEINGNKYKLPISRVALVKSSNGISEKRYVIKTNLIIFNRVEEIEFSLTNRENMSFPLLLGRNFLMKGFLVDVTKENLSFGLNNW